MSELLRIKKDDLPMLKGAKKRDVMIHSAVTITNTSGGVEIIGCKEDEICQHAGMWQAHKVPIPESHVRRAFDEMKELSIERMRKCGLIR